MASLVPVMLLLALSMAGCGPIRENPVTLLPFEYQPSADAQRVAGRWVAVTSAPPPARTDTITTSVGATPVLVTMGGYDIPAAQLLTEQEQREIVRMLENVHGGAHEGPCVVTVAFTDLDYRFRGHQYWATVSLGVMLGSREILRGTERIWSAEGMSFSQRMSTDPRKGKQALARQVVDKLGHSMDASADLLSACDP